MVVFILGCTGSPLQDVANEKNKKATHFFAWEWWHMASQYAWHCNPSLQLILPPLSSVFLRILE
jgi:hypothetical protein